MDGDVLLSPPVLSLFFSFVFSFPHSVQQEYTSGPFYFSYLYLHVLTAWRPWRVAEPTLLVTFYTDCLYQFYRMPFGSPQSMRMCAFLIQTILCSLIQHCRSRKSRFLTSKAELKDGIKFVEFCKMCYWSYVLRKPLPGLQCAPIWVSLFVFGIFCGLVRGDGMPTPVSLEKIKFQIQLDFWAVQGLLCPRYFDSHLFLGPFHSVFLPSKFWIFPKNSGILWPDPHTLHEAVTQNEKGLIARRKKI